MQPYIRESPRSLFSAPFFDPFSYPIICDVNIDRIPSIDSNHIHQVLPTMVVFVLTYPLKMHDMPLPAFSWNWTSS
ncbi:hypothetical protein VTI28DRAFT_8709 [Corynascus sepedonium]